MQSMSRVFGMALIFGIFGYFTWNPEQIAGISLFGTVLISAVAGGLFALVNEGVAWGIRSLFGTKNVAH